MSERKPKADKAVTVTLQLSVSDLPSVTARVLSGCDIDWTLADDSGEQVALFNWDRNILTFSDRLEAEGYAVHWQCAQKRISQSKEKSEHCHRPTYYWPANPSVLAIVPHWKCEQWLRRCLHSVVNQSHPLTNVVVVDDGSDTSPVEIIKAFPSVTLLASPVPQVGPYRLVQSVIERVDYTAFLFQDADDWSSRDRLQTLLNTACAHKAELVGSQEIRVVEPEQTLQAVGYPIEVNAALRYAPGHALLHPTSLVTQSLLQRVGGFATGLRFGADSEFLLRAHWIARSVNSAQFCYFRRKRPESLTTASDTGLDSVERKVLTARIKEKAIANKQAIEKGEPPDLTPLSVKPLLDLRYVCGPKLRWR